MTFADADKHAPSKEMFSAVVRRIMTLIISEMKQEPYYDTPESKNKVIFLEELSSKSESLEWGKFVAELSDPLLSIISKKSKLLPLNQYEEAQRKLNLHLRNGQNLARLKDLLCKVCVTELLPRVAGRIVFRIATKLMDEIQLFVAKELRASRATGRPHSAQPEEVQEMSEAEEKSFAEMLGYLFRESLKRDKRCNSRQKQAQSLCLKETFICAQNPPSFEQFLNKENWLSGDENSIVPSENAINFFQIVEQCVKSERSIHKLNTLDKVINSLLHSIEALELWFHLTDARLSEECALFFMREIVTTFVNKSIHLEDSRKNRLEEKNRQESQAALRTHLLRNYKSTDAEDVDCPSAS